MTNEAIYTGLFEPCHRAHAIAEMTAFVEYSPRVQEAITAVSMDRISAAFGGAFAIESTQNHRVQVGPTGHSVTFEKAFILRKVGSEQSTDWVIRFENTSSAVHCLNYSRWYQVWPEALEYMMALTTLIGPGAVEVTTFGLRYLDQFLFKGALAEYSLASLLKQSKFIHPYAFDSGPRWHCHTGWFADNSKKAVLNQLYLNGVVPAPEGPTIQETMVSIDHVQILRKADQPLDELLESFAEGSHLDRLGQHLHSENRSVMLELLQPDVARRINLHRDEKS